MAAMACAEVTMRVERGLPFHSTTQVEEKFAPVTVRLKPALPATALAGESLLLSCGAGLGAWLLETVQPDRDKSSSEQIHIFFTVFPVPTVEAGRNRLPVRAGPLD